MWLRNLTTAAVMSSITYQYSKIDEFYETTADLKRFPKPARIEIGMKNVANPKIFLKTLMGQTMKIITFCYEVTNFTKMQWFFIILNIAL